MVGFGTQVHGSAATCVQPEKTTQHLTAQKVPAASWCWSGSPADLCEGTRKELFQKVGALGIGLRADVEMSGADIGAGVCRGNDLGNRCRHG